MGSWHSPSLPCILFSEGIIPHIQILVNEKSKFADKKENFKKINLFLDLIVRMLYNMSRIGSDDEWLGLITACGSC